MQEANTLLAHFHYYSKDLLALSQDCKDNTLRVDAGLDEEQIKFIQGSRTYAKLHGMSARALSALVTTKII